MTGLALLILLLASAGGLSTLEAPVAGGGDAPREEVSASRARADLEVVAAEPHPIGTPRQRAVRDHLLDRLRGMGLEAEVQRATVADLEDPGWAVAATVENVVGRLPGREPTGALLLAAHYDSVPGSPGANDDAAAVAALLETARALQAGDPPPRDVVFLFSDGEEPGLWGARAFQRHRWAGDVGLVANFEARGLGGPSVLFETGPGTGAGRVRRFAAATPRPVAASYAQDVYRYMPNDTDFSVLGRGAGLPGFNFAYAEGLAGYHSRLDDLSRVAPASLQHHAEHALALARSAGAIATRGGGGPATYFNLPSPGGGPALVTYPSSWAPVPLLIGGLLLITALARARRNGDLRWTRVIAATSLPLVATAAGALVAMAADRLVAVLAPTSRTSLDGPWPYLAGLMVLSLLTVTLVHRLALTQLRPRELRLGGLLGWGLLALVALVMAASSSYLFAWPLLAAATAALLRERRGEARPAAAPGLIAASLTWAALGLLWAPLVFMVGIAFGPDGVVLVALLSGLGASLAVSLLPAAPLPRRYSGAALTATVLAGLTCVGIALATAGWDSERPRPDTLFYVLDADRGEAWWATFDDTAAGWRSGPLADARWRDFPDLFTAEPYELLSAPAAALPLAPPRLEVLEERAAPGGRRWLRVRATSPRGAHRARLALHADAGPVRLLRIGDQALEEPWRGEAGEGAPTEARPGHAELRYYGVPEEGFVLEVEAPAGPLTATLVDRVPELPAPPDGAPPRRSDGRMPDPYRPTDFSEVRSRAEL